MNTPDLRWLAMSSSAVRSWPLPPAPWRRRLLSALSAPRWQAVIALLAALGLLFAFQQVVSGAVRQGELRRVAMASSLDHRALGNSPLSPAAAKRSRATK